MTAAAACCSRCEVRYSRTAVLEQEPLEVGVQVIARCRCGERVTLTGMGLGRHDPVRRSCTCCTHTLEVRAEDWLADRDP